MSTSSLLRQKGRDLTQFYENAHTPTEKSKKHRNNVTNATKTSITQRLRTDLGRSEGVTAATSLVWFNRFTGAQPSH